jgi:hypothetical protein
VIVFLAIIVAAAIPGVTITAAAPRPPAYRLAEAQRLGHQLENQVRFWFGFMLWGSLAVFSIVVGKGLEWRSDLPRPSIFPHWLPLDGGAWMIFVSASLAVFAVVRLPRIVRAVLDLIALGTTAHLTATRDNLANLEAELADQLAKAPPPSPRGPAERRTGEARQAG